MVTRPPIREPVSGAIETKVDHGARDGKGPRQRDRVAPGGHASQRWHTVPSELALGGGVLMYFGVRGLTVGNADVALRHAGDIGQPKQGLGVYVEPSWQGLVEDSHF